MSRAARVDVKHFCPGDQLSLLLLSFRDNDCLVHISQQSLHLGLYIK